MVAPQVSIRLSVSPIAVATAHTDGPGHHRLACGSGLTVSGPRQGPPGAWLPVTLSPDVQARYASRTLQVTPGHSTMGRSEAHSIPLTFRCQWGYRGKFVTAKGGGT
jgi:hypothetical protein